MTSQQLLQHHLQACNTSYNTICKAATPLTTPVQGCNTSYNSCARLQHLLQLTLQLLCKVATPLTTFITTCGNIQFCNTYYNPSSGSHVTRAIRECTTRAVVSTRMQGGNTYYNPSSGSHVTRAIKEYTTRAVVSSQSFNHVITCSA